MKHTKTILQSLFLLFFSSCKSCLEKEPPFALQEFNGRDEIITYGQMVRRPVYHAKVPLNWQRIDPPAHTTLLDTTKPLVTFLICDKITLAVHNFPTNSLEERIPTAAQVERWRSQLKAGTSYFVKEIGHSGFCGHYFEGKNDKLTICGWSLQLDLEHYQTLHFLTGTIEEEEHYKQMGADLTIKVSGPTELIERCRKEISLFTESFELIQELPTR